MEQERHKAKAEKDKSAQQMVQLQVNCAMAYVNSLPMGQ